MPLHNLNSYRTQSPLFSITFPPPPNNIFGLDPPLTRDAVSDGFWIMLAPLSPGAHVVDFHARLPRFKFAVDVTYNLTVQ